MREVVLRLYNKQLSECNRRSIFSLLEHNPEASYLDLGCSDGTLTLGMASKIGTHNINGIDIIGKHIEGMVRVMSDLESPFPFPNASFDIVTGSQIIEHLSNTDGFVEEVYRVLKPGGYAILSTPNLSSLHIILLLLVGVQPITCSISDKMREDWMDEGPRHRRLFTMRGLVKLVTHYGFKVERKVYSGFSPFPYWVGKVVSVNANCITVKVRKV